ncbi:spore coat protein [Proteiniborus sp. MB09-C3]|uniref:spore coat protein n=1 Tax=Proteiniborus sp. MB09-C3 TaxID=3050072 RepID=UPI002556AA75|nr:spore coat protein [Proteiniborus sp. MB09-C3]WIV13807.1 spore coat protein [Proteiniborus sp. MB09-C3]
MSQLTQKEKYLLEDQKSQEELCVKKYNNYAQQTQCPQLKQLCQQLAQQEQQHLNTINQILSGQTPSMGQQQGQQQGQKQGQQGQQQGQQNSSMQSMSSSGQTGMTNQQDADLCTDLLSTEKYVSGVYNTAIFEFRDPSIRQALNHIQKEEQQHGEQIFNYMQSKGMYNPK